MASGLPAAGNISTQPLEQIVRTLCQERRSAVISIRAGGEQAQIEIEHGEITRTRYKEAEGDEALVRILSLTSGTFELDLKSSPQEGEQGHAHLSRIIVEALKRRAQIEALTHALGGLDEKLRVDMSALARHLQEVPDEVNPIIRLCDGNRSLDEVLATSPFDEVISLRVLERLAAMRIVRGSRMLDIELDDKQVVSPEPPARAIVESSAAAASAQGPEQLRSATASERIEAFISTPPTSVEPEAPAPDDGADASARVVAAAAPAAPDREAPAGSAPDGAQAVEPTAAAAVEADASPAPPSRGDDGRAQTTPPPGADDERQQVSAAWRTQLEAAAGSPASISLWPTAGAIGSPVVARWTNYPNQAPPEIPSAAGTREGGGSSIAEALGGSPAGPDASARGLPDWLDEQEASFFSQSAGRPLPTEQGLEPPARDLFPLALLLAFVVMVVVGAGVFLWSAFGERIRGVPVTVAASDHADEVKPQARPTPVIIPADEEAKLQSPFEAAADVARGTHAEESATVLEIGAPVVKVLRDVEDLGPAPRAQEAPAEATEGAAVTPPAPEATAVSPSSAPATEVPPAPAPAPDAEAAVPPAEPEAETIAIDDLPPVPEPPPPPPPPPPDEDREQARKGFAQLYAEGVQLLQRERYAQALSKFEAALLQDPGDARVYLSIGQIYFEYGNLERALSFYSKAEALGPRRPKVHLLMGLALHEAGRLEEARAHYQTYLSLAPDGAEAPAVRGILKTLPEQAP